MIEIIELPELVAIGIEVQASWEELQREVPAAWERLFAAETDATSFLEVSLGRTAGIYRELLGFLAAARTRTPEGMSRVVIPAQRYVRLIHDGPLEDIAAGFGTLYAYAEKTGLRPTDFKLDFGYVPGLPAGRHELHVALAPDVLRLA
jgi:predicted transcriptional regulator YdeE